jgi:hypothetical protein
MDSSPDRALTQLARGEALRIGDGSGKAIAVFQGSAWIGRDDGQNKRLLGAGESLELVDAGPIVVRALADTALLVIEAVPA